MYLNLDYQIIGLLIVLFFMYLSILIIFKHSTNIRRLLNQFENQIKL